MGLTMPINGANLGLNSDSAMVGRWGADNQASMMDCVQKKMEGCEAHHISVHLQQQQQRAPPARTSAKVTCRRSPPSRCQAVEGRTPELTVPTSQRDVVTKEALDLGPHRQELERGLVGVSKFHVFDIDKVFQLAQAMAIHHPPGHSNVSSMFSIVALPLGSHRQSVDIGTSHAQGRDEMGLHTAGCLFCLGDRFVSSRSTA